MSNHQLSPLEKKTWDAIRHVFPERIDRHSGCTLGQLTEYLGEPFEQVEMSTEMLEKKGFVTRAANGDNPRNMFVVPE